MNATHTFRQLVMLAKPFWKQSTRTTRGRQMIARLAKSLPGCRSTTGDQTSAAQTASLYADMIEDLSGCSEGLLRAAAADYRSDPAAKFFPRSGDLIGRLDIANRRRVRARFNLLRALANDAEKNSKQVAQVEPSAHPVPKERRKELADMARKVARGFSTPPMENTQ